MGPQPPASLTATALNATTVRLQWTDNSSDEDGFTIINGITSRTAAANATTLDWDGLAPGTHTCFKIRSYRASGMSAYFPAAQADWICVTTPAT